MHEDLFILNSLGILSIKSGGNRYSNSPTSASLQELTTWTTAPTIASRRKPGRSSMPQWRIGKRLSVAVDYTRVTDQKEEPA